MTLAGLVKMILGIFNVILPVLAALALALFFVGVIKYIRHAGKTKDRGIMLWSLVALFVLFSFWGILRLFTNTFLGSNNSEFRSDFDEPGDFEEASFL